MLQSMEKNTDQQPQETVALVVPLRVVFDPSNLEDKAVYLHFMQTGKWIKRYVVEWPSVTVPATCERKLLEHFLQVEDVMKKAEQLVASCPVTTLVVLAKNTDPKVNEQ